MYIYFLGGKKYLIDLGNDVEKFKLYIEEG